MYVKALAVAAMLLSTAAVPAFAQTDAKTSSDHAGPIPYSDLAAADAKMNMPAHKAKAHKKAKAAAAAPKAADASAASTTAGAAAK